MKNLKFILVGDRFEDFAKQEGVISASGLRDFFLNNPAVSYPDSVVVGQGVAEEVLHQLKTLAMSKGAETLFIGEDAVFERAGKDLSHKRLRKNILVTEPNEVTPCLYESQVVIDDDCEIMSDHTTGSHLQGMLLIEAARQMFISVTEKFISKNKGGYYFVINGMNATYFKFSFPVSTLVRFVISEVDHSRQDRVKVKARVMFFQLGECTSQVEVDYIAVETEKITRKEREMASEVVGTVIESSTADSCLFPVERVA